LVRCCAALRNILSESEDLPPEEWPSLLGSPGLFDDDRASMVPRLAKGEEFGDVVRAALSLAFEKKAALAKSIGDRAVQEKDSITRESAG
jgi:hypothetical protein